jgi:hypothetical protein
VTRLPSSSELRRFEVWVSSSGGGYPTISSLGHRPRHLPGTRLYNSGLGANTGRLTFSPPGKVIGLGPRSGGVLRPFAEAEGWGGLVGGAILDWAEVVSGRRPEVEGAGKLITSLMKVGERTGRSEGLRVRFGLGLTIGREGAKMIGPGPRLSLSGIDIHQKSSQPSLDRPSSTSNQPVRWRALCK